MSGTATLSVIVPLYNKAPLVRAAVESALADRSAVVEVIVVDDGSIDGGGAEVAAIADPRMRLITQRNGGVSRARNRGIAEARGEFVAFLDADDFWLAGYVPEILALIRAHPGCGMFATSYFVLHEDGSRSAPDGLADDAGATRVIDDYFDAMLRGHLWCTCSLVVRRSVLGSLDRGFPEGEQLGEDLDLFMRLGERTSLAFSPRQLVCYRQSASVGRLSRIELDEPVPGFLRRAVARYRARVMPARLRPNLRLVIGRHFHSVAMRCVETGRRLPALRLLLAPGSMMGARNRAKLLLALLLPRGLFEALRMLRSRARTGAIGRR